MAILVQSNKKPSVTFPSQTGSIVTFNSQYAGLPLKSCTSLITGYQEGSGAPSPDNVRPLHAFSSASLGKCDNNTASLWTIDNSFNGDVAFNQLAQNGNFANASGYVAQNGCTINSISDNVANVSFAGGSNAQLAHGVSLTNGHKFLSMIDIKLANESDSLRFTGGSNTKTTDTVATTEWQTLSLMFNSTYSHWIVKNTTANDVNNAQLRNAVVFDLTVMFGSTIADYIYNLETQTAGAGVAFFKALYPNDYYPYNAGTKQFVGDTLATFTFGQTIYQGYIDWKRGVVVGLWSGKVDMGLLNWGYNSNFQAFYISLPNMYIPTTGQERMQGIANEVYPISTVDAISSMDDKSCLRYNGYLWTKDSDYTDRDIFKNSLMGKYVAYELATPIEIPLGGINLLTQQVNNIWADTGETTVEYIKIGG